MSPGPPTSEPPPLAPWQQTWRYLVVVLFSSGLFAEIAVRLWDKGPAWVVVDVILGVLSTGSLHWRRRFPVGVAVLTALASMASTLSLGASVLALVSLATHRRWRQILPVSALGLISTYAYVEIQPVVPAPWWQTAGFNVVTLGVLVATGMYVGARRELIATLQDRAERAEREQELRATQARTTERARIAREMHDVLAHRISLVAMHAGALAYRTDLDPAEVRRTAEVIQTNAHLAMTDLREVLGLLRDGSPRDDEAALPERPQPTLRDLPELVTEARAAGMRVTLTDTVASSAEVPEALGRNAYRMIQESLTNARKHAPNTPVTIVLTGAAGSRLLLEVRNPLQINSPGNGSPGSGLGLLGLAERAVLAGGRLDHETTPERDFVVRAWLPWP